MSAPTKCPSCKYKWDFNDTWGELDGLPCDYCREYDAENEIFTAFHAYEPATNEDRVKNISRMDTEELAILLNELGQQRTTYDWYNWLRQEVPHND